MGEESALHARSRVAVAACPSYSPPHVAAALAEALAAVGPLSALVKPGQTVLVKPNLFSSHPPEHAVTTHPELVRQVVLLCAEAGAGRIWVGDSPVGRNTEALTYARTGIAAAVAGTPAELKSWQVTQAPRACGDDMLPIPGWYDEVDAVVSLPKLKTHVLTTLTCGLKNVYGLVSGQSKAWFHTKYPSPAAMSAFLVRVFAALKPRLTITDAVVAMEGNGPSHGRPLPVGALLASRDAVALDAVGCTALGIEPAAVPMIRLAAGDGLGCMERARIDCVGSGVTSLRAARMKPSLARHLMRVPEAVYGLTPRFLQLRPKIQERECVRCGICVDTCPRDAIATSARSGRVEIIPEKCIACYCCLESCPQGAVAVQLYLANRICIGRQRRAKFEAQ
jgi:uncharacterized protein (DUF362 family)/NAD-dependent dihydropyrimidine dehydrogenase PreA subunit